MRAAATILSFVRRWIVLVVAALALLGYGLWRHYDPGPGRRLLDLLPSGQALYLFIDGESIRHRRPFGEVLLLQAEKHPWFEPWLAAGEADPADSFQGAAFAAGRGGAWLVVGGRFSELALRRALEQRGATCGESLRESPCLWREQGAETAVHFRLLGDEVLGLTIDKPDAPEAAFVAPGAGGGAGAVAKKAAGYGARGAPVWAFVDPAEMEAAMRNPPAGWINLTLFARSLSRAREAVFTLTESRDTEGRTDLLLHLQAECPGAAEAQQLQALLLSLNQFAAGALNLGREENERNPWAGVLQGSRFIQSEQRVEGFWTIPLPLLLEPLAARR